MATRAAGTRLGPYEILGFVAEGGMGDVYRARDTRLDRIVALKISKEAFTPRFETEARATAALEHQHICRLYDVCHEAGASFLVMEYVEGTPLRGPVSLEQALTYARQIASALDEAHRKQIIHRDLKPANILITPKGGVKLLDFGIAKFGRDLESPLNDEALTQGLTAAGTIVGTLHYMSPEQLQGKPADARSDIFAFGLVLYELVTGKRAFDGGSAASVIAAILERPAPSVTPVAPAALDRVISRCLAKDPEERWQSARDVRAALDLVAEPSIPLQESSPPPVRKTMLWPWLAAGVMAAGLVALAFVHFRESTPKPGPVRFQIAAPANTTIVSAPLVSPNGRAVAFVTLRDDGRLSRSIWVRDLESLDARMLPGTEGSFENIFWSPDSRALAFVSDGKLKTIDVANNVVRTVCDARTPGGGSWGEEGVIIFSELQRGLFRVAAGGGVPVQVTKPTASEALHAAPSFLPDGRRFIYASIGKDRKIEGRVATIDGRDLARFGLDEGSRVAFVPPRSSGQHGHILYGRSDALIAQPVDDATFAPAGESVVVTDKIGVVGPSSSPVPFSVNAAGMLAYLAGDVRRPSALMWFDRKGDQIAAVGPEARYNDLSLSPDESVVAVTRSDGANDDIWMIDVARNLPTRFTSDAAQDWHPVWSPDGNRLAFSSTRTFGGRSNSIFWKDTRFVGNEELVYAAVEGNFRLNDWSPDGKLLLITDTRGLGNLLVLPVTPDSAGTTRAPTAFLETRFSETRAQFFPVADPAGRYRIAYTSDETGRNEIYVGSFPGGARPIPISNAGGIQPRWRRDGRELFYISLDRKLMAVDVTRHGDQLQFGAPHELFPTHMSMTGTAVERVLRYDVTRDGKRFLINTEVGEASSAAITVVLNWTALLEK